MIQPGKIDGGLSGDGLRFGIVVSRFNSFITERLLQGETAHYDYVCSETSRGLQLAQMDTGVPVMFCVLTCDTLEQAIDRAGLKGGNKGFEAGLAAVEMAQLSRKLRASPSKPAAAGKPRRK